MYGPDVGPTTSIVDCVFPTMPSLSGSGARRLLPSSSRTNTAAGSISSIAPSGTSHVIVLLSITTPGTNPSVGPRLQNTLSPGVNPEPMMLTDPSTFSVTVVSSGVSKYS